MKFNLNAKFEEDTSFQHPELTKVAVWIATYGQNANGSDIPREAFEEAIPSLYNMPILGEFCETLESSDNSNSGVDGDFKGHGGKIIIDDSGVQWVATTKAYGVVPESCNPRWEFDQNGEEYLVCDGFLWTGRYEEANKVKDNLCNQSMEIVPLDTYTKDGVTHITKFNFSGLCILGEDTTPCFPSAKVVYSLNKEDIKEDFNLLLEELKNIKFEMGGSKVNRDEIIKMYAHLNGEEYQAIINDTSLSDEELQTKLFALSNNDLRKRVRESLSAITYTQEYSWGESYECQKYYYEDLIPDDNIVICEDGENWYTYYGIPYSLNGDSVVLDEANKKRYVRGDWREYVEGSVEPTSQVFELAMRYAEEKIESLQGELTKKSEEFSQLNTSNEEVKTKCFDLESELTTLKENYSKAQEDLESLKAYKSEIEKKEFEKSIDDVVEKFALIKDMEEFKEIYENRYNYSAEDLTKAIKIFCFDNNISLEKLNKVNKTKEDKSLKFNLNDPNSKDNKPVNSDWLIFDKYINE